MKALLPSASAAGKKKREEQERQTQTHHKDPEAEADAKMILMRNYIDPKRFYKVRELLVWVDASHPC